MAREAELMAANLPYSPKALSEGCWRQGRTNDIRL